MKRNTVLLAGLPSSGKTTFIAAFWFYLTMSDSRSNNLLQLESVTGSEEEYLNEIARKWAGLEPVNRNRLEDKGISVEIKLINKVTREKSILEIPDFSGETFVNHFEHREWGLSYDKMVNALHGLVLFINPTDADMKPKSLFYESRAIELILGQPLESSNAGLSLLEWEHSIAPSQVKLVEIFQFMLMHSNVEKMRLSIVISMWDQVSAVIEVKPERWLEANMPLLYQFLICNNDTFSYKCFGVSAQGGDYSNQELRLQLANRNNQLDRIIVVEDETSSNNIVKPILWVLE